MEFNKTIKYTCLHDDKQKNERLYMTSCGIEQCVPGKSFGPLARTDYHLHVVVSGKGTLTVGDTSYAIHGNQIFLVKSGEESYYQADQEDPWYYCWVSFTGTEAEDYVNNIGFGGDEHVLDCYIDKQDLLNTCSRLLSCQEPTPAHDMRRNGCALEFLSYMLENISRKDSADNYQQGNSSELYVEHALEQIHLHYDDIRIADIAEMVGINRSYLTSIFKKKMGISPQKYLLQYRLNMASHLLKTTNLSIQEVARRVGYDNPLTFSKMFHNTYGESPSNYRISQKKAM